MVDLKPKVSSKFYFQVICVTWNVILLNRDLTESAYEKLADETLDALADYFEDLTDESFTASDYDVVFSVSIYTVYVTLQQFTCMWSK